MQICTRPLFVHQSMVELTNPPSTFLKRKGGLFKKAHELSVLCSVDVAVIIFGHNKKLYEFSSGDINETIGRYQYVCQTVYIYFPLPWLIVPKPVRQSSRPSVETGQAQTSKTANVGTVRSPARAQRPARLHGKERRR